MVDLPLLNMRNVWLAFLKTSSRHCGPTSRDLWCNQCTIVSCPISSITSRSPSSPWVPGMLSPSLIVNSLPQPSAHYWLAPQLPLPALLKSVEEWRATPVVVLLKLRAPLLLLSYAFLSRLLFLAPPMPSSLPPSPHLTHDNEQEYKAHIYLAAIGKIILIYLCAISCLSCFSIAVLHSNQTEVKEFYLWS